MMDGVGWSVEECLKAVRGNLGDGFEHLCDIRDFLVIKDLVIGWLVVVEDVVVSPGERVVHVYPLVLNVGGDFSFREAEMSIDLGYFPDRKDLESFGVHYKLGRGEKVVGVLPSWPNTYYVRGYVNNIAFDLGVHVNPDDERLRELLLNAYLDWLRGPEARDLKSKLAELKLP
jgi:hypothetical protein